MKASSNVNSSKSAISRKSKIPVFLIILGVVLVFVAAFVIVSVLKMTAPQPEEVVAKVVVPSVRIYTAEKTSRALEVRTQGTVEPRTETTLTAEVSGRILEVSEAMVAGGFFKKGDVLFRIDPRDYQSGLTTAIAQVAQAEADLATEEAEAKQARIDWERLGQGGEPSDLLLRLPQLVRAEAAVASAKAALEKAHNDLKRTSITAPYDGRSREKMAEMGQFANVGDQVGRIFATDYVEIRLPLSDDELGKIDPDILKYRNEEWTDGPKVTITGDVAGNPHTWQGSITRLEGVVDNKTRFYYAIARINDPYGRERSQTAPLTVGLFVDVVVEGRRVSGISEIPRRALHPGNRVYLVDSDNKLQIRTVEVISSGADSVLIGSGLQSGDRVITSPLAVPAVGMQLAILDGEQPKNQGIAGGENTTEEQSL
ncbi:MAG: efflux RND transporter periplasmic adaptor subunit [Verrucomicrobiota bacterium]